MEKWLLFNLLLLMALAFDLYSFRKSDQKVSRNKAIFWSIFWFMAAVIFGASLGYFQSVEMMELYFAGYLIEKSLSVDNLFIFITIFLSYNISPRHQHRILFWGVVGALIFRGIAIWLGALLLEKYSWLFFVFGAFLLYTGISLFRERHDRESKATAKETFLYKMIQRFIPIHSSYKGEKFFVRIKGKLMATPLLAALISIEIMDIVFAVDSVPAIFAITSDPFIVYTSNAMAILGLRALFYFVYTALANLYYLRHALSFILIFIAVKMLFHGWLHVPVSFSLGYIIVVLAVGYIASRYKLRHTVNPL